jgi:transketolase
MRNRIIDLIEAEAAHDPRVTFLTGDLGFSVVEPLETALGERFINMGVAEANMISVAGSLAATGLKPLCYSITPFITSRCFEQIRNDIVYQQRAVRLIGVGSGFSYGTLGPSHHGMEDAAIMASLPELVVVNPANAAELDRVYAITHDAERPTYFRIARESGVAFTVPIFSLDRGAYMLREGADVTLVASGVTVTESLRAAEMLASEGVGAGVISVPVLSPFPRETLARLLGDASVVSVFEGYRGNPLSVGVMETLLGAGAREAYRDMHAPQSFPHVVGGTDFLRRNAGLDAASIAGVARELAANRSNVRRFAR